jgi:hypothetical protein
MGVIHHIRASVVSEQLLNRLISKIPNDTTLWCVQAQKMQNVTASESGFNKIACITS